MNAVPRPTAAPACYHCGLPVPADSRWSVRIDAQPRPMCCPGCAAVAQTIVDIGQSAYYSDRAAFAAPADQAALAPPELQLYDNADARFQDKDGNCAATFSVEGITCAACVWLIESRLVRLPGVSEAHMNVATERLHVRWDKAVCQPGQILQALRGIGYAAYPYDPVRHGRQLHSASKQLGRQLFVAGLSMMQVMMYAVPAYLAADDGTLDPGIAAMMRWASLVLTLPAVFYSALPFFKGALASLRARALGMDVPVALGVAAAFAASLHATWTGRGEVYFDSVTMFIFLLLCSRYLELGARRKASTALERLRHALPAAATRLDDYPRSRDGRTVAAAALVAGDIILVKPGEAIAADAVIVEGETALDLSLLTGESAPQRKRRGDEVPGGAINARAAVLLRVLRAARDSTLSDLIDLVERAGQAKPRIAQWADRVAARFVGALLLFALASFAAWCWIDAARAWPIAIAVLVVSCPCALSLATPSALAAATDRLLRGGVLVVRPHVLETLHRASHIVFDKTGTLTMGQPAVSGVDLLATMRRDTCLAIAAALEAGSLHPAGAALIAAARREPQTQMDGRWQAGDVRELPGQGLEGRLRGRRYRLGSRSFVAGVCGLPAAGPDPMPPGATPVYLGCDGRWLARFQLSDALREDAADIVAHFRASGKTVVLLSGDEEALTRHVAAALGMDDALGGCLPEDKLAYVQAMQRGGAVLAMVGDGINDAAVLSAADVSFAMGSGAALAQVHADAVLLSGQLAGLRLAARTAGQCMAVIRQNLAWATLYNTLAIPAAALGWLNPWLSGVGMALSSAVVIGNALRLRRN